MVAIRVQHDGSRHHKVIVPAENRAAMNNVCLRVIPGLDQDAREPRAKQFPPVKQTMPRMPLRSRVKLKGPVVRLLGQVFQAQRLRQVYVVPVPPLTARAVARVVELVCELLVDASLREPGGGEGVILAAHAARLSDGGATVALSTC